MSVAFGPLRVDWVGLRLVIWQDNDEKALRFVCNGGAHHIKAWPLRSSSHNCQNKCRNQRQCRQCRAVPSTMSIPMLSNWIELSIICFDSKFWSEMNQSICYTNNSFCLTTEEDLMSVRSLESVSPSEPYSVSSIDEYSSYGSPSNDSIDSVNQNISRSNICFKPKSLRENVDEVMSM